MSHRGYDYGKCNHGDITGISSRTAVAQVVYKYFVVRSAQLPVHA